MRLLRSAILSISLSCMAGFANAEPSVLTRTYMQELTIEFASPADAAKAKIVPTPVLDGKTWAFSARWDDNSSNNLPVHAVMVSAGIKGTFYINESRPPIFGSEYAKNLDNGGCDVGGHTQTHRLLPALLPNEVFWEILANRVQREAEVKHPMVSFAFPGGAYSDKVDSTSGSAIAESFLRSGFHNTPYLGFARQNPNIPLGDVSTGHQVEPGDHVVNLPAFYKSVDRIVAQPARYQKETYCIHMGVHARQTGEDLKKLEEGFRHYAGNPDWWYCTMNEYAAYAMQVRDAKIEAEPGDGATRTYRITRMLPSDAGADVPLTLEVSDAAIVSAQGKDFTCDRVTNASRVLLDLHHGPHEACPTKIDAIVNANNDQAAAPAKPSLAMNGWLFCNLGKKHLELTLKNTSQTALQNVDITLRLPPLYLNGVRHLAPVNLEPGKEQVIIEPLGEEHPESAYSEGRAYYVAEINANTDVDAVRLYATTRLPVASADPAVRDAAHMLGPFNDGDVKPEAVEPLSAADATLADLGSAANLQWFTSTAGERVSIKPDRATLYRYNAAWKAIAGLMDMKPQDYLIALDFTTAQATHLKLTTGAKILGIALNGKSLTAGNEIDVPTVGKNRLIFTIKTEDGRAIWTAYPLYFHLEPTAGSVTYDVAPPEPPTK